MAIDVSTGRMLARGQGGRDDDTACPESLTRLFFSEDATEACLRLACCAKLSGREAGNGAKSKSVLCSVRCEDATDDEKSAPFKAGKGSKVQGPRSKVKGQRSKVKGRGDGETNSKSESKRKYSTTLE
ncbi:hypothetical protein E4U53_005217 [Claviceps sorghi]|nr:hypothetical protein E4U53_005217 [Claviceps sorghi]